MKLIDDFLNSITMYRLVLYVLIFFWTVAEILSLFGLLPFRPLELFFSALFLIAVCWVTNTIFAKVFEVPTNLESIYITALILTLIITPIKGEQDLIFLGWMGILAMSSKYILAIDKKNIFNPAAVAVVIGSLTLNNSASWWIGTSYMLLPVLLGGLLIVRKIRRSDLVFSFIFISLILILGMSALKGEDVLATFQRILLDTPILFLAFVMLTEPLTTPPTKLLQIIYGGIVGFLFVPQLHIGSIYSTPEIALIFGNIFSYIVSPKERLLLKLKEKIQIAPDIYDFLFGLDKPLKYLAGQYMEWTLGQKNPDSRGSRRYFTIASSPTENSLKIGVKFYPNGSSFKKKLLSLNTSDLIVASQLAGEFILPRDINKKLVFIAGGIGITPFRSIIKYLLDTNQKRDIILLYSNKTQSDIVYKDIFDEAFQKLGIRTVYVNTDIMGFIDEKMIREQVSDFKDRIFYISGPHSMIDAFEKILKTMGVIGSQIKIDFFPGYA